MHQIILKLYFRERPKATNSGIHLFKTYCQRTPPGLLLRASAADISFSKGNVLVLDKFETLIAVERELRVEHQSHGRMIFCPSL